MPRKRFGSSLIGNLRYLDSFLKCLVCHHLSAVRGNGKRNAHRVRVPSLGGDGSITVPKITNTTGPNSPLIDSEFTQLVGTKIISAPLLPNASLGVHYGASTAGEQCFNAGTSIELVTRTNLTSDASTYSPMCYQRFHSLPQHMLILTFTLIASQIWSSKASRK